MPLVSNRDLRRVATVVFSIALLSWVGVGAYQLVNKSRIPKTPSNNLVREIFPTTNYLITDFQPNLDLRTLEGTADGKTKVLKVGGSLSKKDNTNNFWTVVVRSGPGNKVKAVGFPVHERTKFYPASPEDIREGDTIEVYSILDKLPPEGGALLVLKQ